MMKKDRNQTKKRPKKQTLSWIDVKLSLKDLDQEELLGLISDLYDLSQDNRDFLHTRFSIGADVLTPYRKIIQTCMYPDILNEDVRIDRAERAVSDYVKASRDVRGEAELLTFLVECGNQFTLDYGDIDEYFYDSLVEIYAQTIKKVLTLPEDEQKHFKIRLKKIMLSAKGIGWGYHDGLGDEYYDAFEEDE